MSKVLSTVVVALWLAGLASLAAAAEVTPPETHLGRPVGVDFQLADWSEVKSYFLKLDRESPCVVVQKIGVTTEGRDFLLATITSEENLRQLDYIKDCARTIADPRGKSPEAKEEAVRKGKAILMISCAIHATETAAPQFGMEFAYKLATSPEEHWAAHRPISPGNVGSFTRRSLATSNRSSPNGRTTLTPRTRTTNTKCIVRPCVGRCSNAAC